MFFKKSDSQLYLWEKIQGLNFLWNACDGTKPKPKITCRGGSRISQRGTRTLNEGEGRRLIILPIFPQIRMRPKFYYVDPPSTCDILDTVITVRKRSCRKVMCSQVSVNLFTGGDGMPGPMCLLGVGKPGPMCLLGVGMHGSRSLPGGRGMSGGRYLYPPSGADI